MAHPRSLLLFPLAVSLMAQAPAKGSLGLTPAQMDGVIQDLAGNIPFQRKEFSIHKVFAALKAKGAREEAKPLLPSEFLALPEDQRRDALHPDTTCLLALQLSRAAVWAQPEESRSKDWMMPVLIRAQEVGNASSSNGLRGDGSVLGGNAITMAPGTGRKEGPNWPLLEWRRNLPGTDPRIGLDQSSRMVEPDRPARNWRMQHSGGVFTYAPQLFFAPDDQSRVELEGWVLARILVARAEGAWDAPALKLQFLALAMPRIPAWDLGLTERAQRAKAALSPAAPADRPKP